MASSRSGGVRRPSSVRQVKCSRPSTPASTACQAPRREWVWARTGRPASCARSTTSAQVRGGELHAELVGAGGQHAAGGHHLDHVDPALDVLGHGRADRVSALGDAAQVVAVPVGDGERRSRPPRSAGRRARRRRGSPASGSSGRPGRGPWSPLRRLLASVRAMTASISSSAIAPTASRLPGTPSATRCTCASTSPGSRVPSYVVTSTSAGSSKPYGSTPTMRSPSTRTVAPPARNRSPSKATGSAAPASVQSNVGGRANDDSGRPPAPAYPGAFVHLAR